LVVGGERADPECRARSQELAIEPARVRLRADRVDHAQVVDIAADLAVLGPLAEEEFELRPDLGVEAELRQRGLGPAHEPARVGRLGLALALAQAEAGGGPGGPLGRGRRIRAGAWARGEVPPRAG